MTRPTRPGPTRPLISAGSLSGDGGTLFGGAIGQGQVPTSTGSNTWAWASNVALISANGSNYATGPYVDFAAGSNIILAVASNTVTIHSSGSGGGGASPDDNYAWMPLTSIASNTGLPELVWDDDDSLIPTLVPLE